MDTLYNNPDVRRRIEEYLGMEDGGPASCVYLARPDHGWPEMETISRPEELDSLLDPARDLSRSLWDRKSLIAHLDIEYVNFDNPNEAYIHPERTFDLQTPVYRAVKHFLSRYGIDSRHLITGRGHHFVWCIPVESCAFLELMRIGYCCDTLLECCRNLSLPMAGHMPENHARAFAGLGLVMEYLANRIKTRAAETARVPVELTAAAVGPGERGREMVSIDISEYGDPLHLRVIRVPFTAYMKNHLPCHPGFPGIVPVAVPEQCGIREALTAARNPEKAVNMAKETSAHIPQAAGGTQQLTAEYKASLLHAFHERFYDQPHHPPEMWSATYDRMPLHLLPPCAAHILSCPNDLLMQPAAIELVVRALLSLGWHPRHIAGLIRSKYERDYGWGDQWLIHDAASRADFYTRIFAGSFACGTDDLLDFNCVSTREKGLCFNPAEQCPLLPIRTSLLERRRHDRLADRPFNRLFLPNKHL